MRVIPFIPGFDTLACDLGIEQSPAKAEKVTRDSAMYRFLADTVVPPSADPQPGYQFAYRLGDVADPKSQRTGVQIDAPKIIVAVFRPADDDRFEEIKFGGGDGGNLPRAISDSSTPGGSPSGSGRSTTKTVFVPVLPTPEPTTILLPGLGTLVLRRIRRP